MLDDDQTSEAGKENLHVRSSRKARRKAARAGRRRSGADPENSGTATPTGAFWSASVAIPAASDAALPVDPVLPEITVAFGSPETKLADDPEERALALWKEGRKDQAIAILEREIAWKRLEREGAPPPLRATQDGPEASAPTGTALSTSLPQGTAVAPAISRVPQPLPNPIPRSAAPFRAARRTGPLLGIALSCLAVTLVWAGREGWLGDMAQRAVAEPLAIAAPDRLEATDNPGRGPAANGGEVLRLAAIRRQDGERAIADAGLEAGRPPADAAPDARERRSAALAGAPEHPSQDGPPAATVPPRSEASAQPERWPYDTVVGQAAAPPAPVGSEPPRAGTVARAEAAPMATGSIPVAREERPDAPPMAREEARAETASARPVPQTPSATQRRPSEPATAAAAGHTVVATAASGPSPAEGSRAAAGAPPEPQPVREARLPRPRPDKAPVLARSNKSRVLARADKPRRTADRRRSAASSAKPRRQRPPAPEAPAAWDPPVVVYYYQPYRPYRPVYRTYLPPPVYYGPPPVYYVPPRRY
jgi:hypothetical protein